MEITADSVNFRCADFLSLLKILMHWLLNWFVKFHCWTKCLGKCLFKLKGSDIYRLMLGLQCLESFLVQWKQWSLKLSNSFYNLQYCQNSWLKYSEQSSLILWTGHFHGQYVTAQDLDIELSVEEFDAIKN